MNRVAKAPPPESAGNPSAGDPINPRGVRIRGCVCEFRSPRRIRTLECAGVSRVCVREAGCESASASRAAAPRCAGLSLGPNIPPSLHSLSLSLRCAGLSLSRSLALPPSLPPSLRPSLSHSIPLARSLKEMKDKIQAREIEPGRGAPGAGARPRRFTQLACDLFLACGARAQSRCVGRGTARRRRPGEGRIRVAGAALRGAAAGQMRGATVLRGRRRLCVGTGAGGFDSIGQATSEGC